MVVKQANITSYKVSDPSEILDRRPVVQIEYKIIIIMFFSENLISLILTLRADNPNCSDKIALAIPKLFNS